MVQQDVLGWNGRIRLEVEYPAAVVMLTRTQRVGVLGVQGCVKHGGVDFSADGAFVDVSGCLAFH